MINYSKINISENNYLVLLKSIDLELLNYYQNIIKSYNAINSIDQNKKYPNNFFTIYIILSTSLILILL